MSELYALSEQIVGLYPFISEGAPPMQLFAYDTVTTPLALHNRQQSDLVLDPTILGLARGLCHISLQARGRDFIWGLYVDDYTQPYSAQRAVTAELLVAREGHPDTPVVRMIGIIAASKVFAARLDATVMRQRRKELIEQGIAEAKMRDRMFDRLRAEQAKDRKNLQPPTHVLVVAE